MITRVNRPPALFTEVRRGRLGDISLNDGVISFRYSGNAAITLTIGGEAVSRLQSHSMWVFSAIRGPSGGTYLVRVLSRMDDLEAEYLIRACSRCGKLHAQLRGAFYKSRVTLRCRECCDAV